MVDPVCWLRRVRGAGVGFAQLQASGQKTFPSHTDRCLNRWSYFKRKMKASASLGLRALWKWRARTCMPQRRARHRVHGQDLTSDSYTLWQVTRAELCLH